MDLIFLVPDEYLMLVIAGIGLAVMVRAISPRRALSLIGVLAAAIMLGPFIEALMLSLPVWVSLVILVCVAVVMLKAAAGLVLGRRITDELTARLAADAVRSIVRLPFRLLVISLRTLLGRRNEQRR